MPYIAHASSARDRQAGFGLIEIMVGMVMGLITILVIFQVYALFEGQKRTTGSAGDTQLNMAQAVMTIERDLRNAGYGFVTGGIQGCEIHADYNGTAFNFTLAPVTIVQGSGTAADSLQIMAGSGDVFSVPARITFDHPSTAINFCVDSTQGISPNDMVIAYEPGKHCVMFQATSVGDDGTGTGSGCTQTQVKHQGGAISPWNPTGAAADALYPQPDGYTDDGGAKLYNVGSFVNRIYSVAGSASATTANLRLNEWDTLAAPTGSAVPTNQLNLVDGVVDLQAQYGKDTDNNGTVDTWDTVTPTTSTDWQTVYAVRFAVAVRSPLIEKTVVTSSSTANWAGGTLTLNRKPDGSVLPNWDHYRYNVLQTVTPLRNMIWRE